MVNNLDSVRYEVMRMYAIAGLNDEHDFNEISTMPVKKLLACALLWDHMADYPLKSNYPNSCGCVVVDNIVYVAYPDFITKKLELVVQRGNFDCALCKARLSCKMYILLKRDDEALENSRYYRYSERPTRSQKTIRILETLVAIESTQPPSVIAAELDTALEKLSQAEKEVKRLSKLLDDIKAKFA